MSSVTNHNLYLASRVHQLDADVLDGEIVSAFSTQLQRTLHYLQMLIPGTENLHQEIVLAIRYYLFRQSLLKKGATLGQEMLGLKLVDSIAHTEVSAYRLHCYCMLTVIGPYAVERWDHLLPHPLWKNISLFIKLMELMNFVIFLTNGCFRSVSHRLLSMTCTLSSSAAIFNPINNDYMSREILWYTFAEFLSFLLPVINPVKVKNYFTRFISNPSPGLNLISPGIRCKSDLMTCAVCSQSPVNAREIGCNHCFCYYCVVTSLLADESHGFTCPKCNFHVRDIAEVRELYLKGF